MHFSINFASKMIQSRFPPRAFKRCSYKQKEIPINFNENLEQSKLFSRFWVIFSIKFHFFSIKYRLCIISSQLHKFIFILKSVKDKKLLLLDDTSKILISRYLYHSFFSFLMCIEYWKNADLFLTIYKCQWHY